MKNETPPHKREKHAKNGKWLFLWDGLKKKKIIFMEQREYCILVLLKYYQLNNLVLSCAI